MEWLEAIGTIVTVITGLAAAVVAWRRHLQKQSQDLSSTSTVTKRFIALFEAHGVHRNQIPEFFDHGLTLADVSSDQSLLEKLSPQILSDAAELFAVELEWLQGATDKVYPTHEFYKQPKEFDAFVDELLSRGNRLRGCVFNTEHPSNDASEYDALIMITEEVGHVNDRPVFRIHLCNHWGFKYWRSRAYLAACIAIAWRKNLCLIGKQTSPKWLIPFARGKALISYNYDDGFLRYPSQSTWYADELVDTPAKFLKGIESSDQGLALSKWLKLDEQGHMEMYEDGSHTAVRTAYGEALAELE